MIGALSRSHKGADVAALDARATCNGTVFIALNLTTFALKAAIA